MLFILIIIFFVLIIIYKIGNIYLIEDVTIFLFLAVVLYQFIRGWCLLCLS
jgi:hypothetical protein